MKWFIELLNAIFKTVKMYNGYHKPHYEGLRENGGDESEQRGVYFWKRKRDLHMMFNDLEKPYERDLRDVL
ncbi:hypothetical protein H5410_001848 [Solanum commersonii]|uniref:Uncharacterized protein n=1 Tax=Solanum commersonii TaxID=4109 RepID=A0A9J6B0S0_SOLCO|nr:hypothetical protein H5410_001848 [Solanum commersonii]